VKCKTIGKNKMLTKLLLVFFVNFIFFGYLAAGSSDEQAITKTLRNYIDGPNEKDVVKLKSAFTGTATIFYVRDNKLVEIKLEDFFRHMEAGFFSSENACNGERSFARPDHPNRISTFSTVPK